MEIFITIANTADNTTTVNGFNFRDNTANTQEINPQNSQIAKYFVTPGKKYNVSVAVVLYMR